MINLEDTIAQIERKIKLVAEQLNEARQQNATLREERDALLQSLEAYKSGNTPEENIEDEHMSDPGQSAVEQTVMQEEIDRYIKDIDHCLDLIKQL